MKSKYLTKKPYRTKREAKRDQELRDLDNRIHDLEENNRVLREALSAKLEAPIRADRKTVLTDLQSALDRLAELAPQITSWMSQDVMNAVLALVPWGRTPREPPPKADSDVWGELPALQRRIIALVRGTAERTMRASDVARRLGVSRDQSDAALAELIHHNHLALTPEERCIATTPCTPPGACCTNGCKATDCPNL